MIIDTCFVHWQVLAKLQSLCQSRDSLYCVFRKLCITDESLSTCMYVALVTWVCSTSEAISCYFPGGYLSDMSILYPSDGASCLR
jgi:hypothetical protein